MENKDIYLSVVIPAYNESNRIGKTLNDVYNFLLAQPYTSEVIVVDDGSTDDLEDAIKKHTQHIPYLPRIVSYPHNRGKGYAVREGMRTAASGRFRLFMDADNSVTIDHVNKFLEEAQQGKDIVIGSIMLPHMSTSIDNNQWYRRFLGKVTKYIRSLLIHIDVYDTQRGFKLFSARAADKLFNLQQIERFGFDFEILALAQMLGYTIQEIPVVWINPEGSKVTLMSYPQTFMELLSIRWKIITGRYNIDR